jgi:hypothetical protein
MSKGEPPMSHTGTDTGKANDLDELKDTLQQIADKAAGYQQIGDAALALIAALDYRDETLVESSFVSMATGLAKLANDCVAKALDVSHNVQARLKEGWQKHIDKRAFEIAVFEDIKDNIESIIDEQIARMLSVRKLARCVEQLGQTVAKSGALEEGIRELRRFREDFFRGWPSRKRPSPINREAISKAREAIGRGEKGISKDQLIWRDKPSEKTA